MRIREYVEREALRFAGAPILANELDKNAFFTEVIEPALYEYYIYAPFEYVKTYDYSSSTSSGSGTGNSGSISFTVTPPDLATEYGSEWPERLTAEHVGLTGFSYKNLDYVGYQNTLLGLDRNPVALVGDIESMIQLHTNRQLLQTVNDQVVGDEQFLWDAVTNQYKIFIPGPGKVGMVFGYRLNNVNRVKPSHAVAFSKIVTKKFLELMVSARSSVVISSDVSLDIGTMQQKLDLLTESYEEDMEAIATPMLTWG